MRLLHPTRPAQGRRAGTRMRLRLSWCGPQERGVMTQTATTAKPSRANRLDRRKARTRQALVDAAVRLIAEGRGERASIQEITEAADIGFGSFYNHFESKEELFRTASEEVLERWGQMIDRACAGLDDPADVVTK